LYPKPYIQYLVHFHGDRDYFECHEILEDYWKRTDRKNKQSIWVGLIQLAVSCYHHRRGNFLGAKKTLEKALEIFKNEDALSTTLGVNGQWFLAQLDDRLAAIHNQKPYVSFNCPNADPELCQQCILSCKKSGFKWCSPSNLGNDALVHRHKLRDRSSVIQTRKKALTMRKGNK